MSLEEEFLRVYFNEMIKLVFRQNTDNLLVLTLFLKLYEVYLLKVQKKLDFANSCPYLYNFCKDHNAKFTLDQKVLFGNIFLFFRNHSELDDLKLKNVLKILQIKFLDQSYPEIKQTLLFFQRTQLQ